MKTSLLLPLVLAMTVCVLGSEPSPSSESASNPSKSLAQLLAPVLAQTKTKTVRIMMGGTSIATTYFSNNQIFISQLKALCGDAHSGVQSMGVISGDWYAPVSGWYKQPYSGPSFVRLRGTSYSQPLSLRVYGSSITVEYSKEADGGSSQVLIDNAVAGTINCQGAQQLSVQATYNLPLGVHSITFQPPANGNVYLERVRYEQGKPGIAVIDTTFGGTGLEHVFNNFPGQGQQVPGIPTQPGVGTAAFFRRPDIDLVIWSGPVNDHDGFNPGFDTWKLHMDEMVESTRGRCPLILIAEMGGHLSLPSDYAHTIYQSQYEYFLQLARDNAHVFTVDWQGATLDSNVQRYVANYYSSAVYDPQTGQVSGDFIHPNAAAHRIALELICSAAGIPVPIEATADQVTSRIARSSPLPFGTAIPFMDGTTLRIGYASYTGASVYASSSLADTLPLIFSPESDNLSTVNTDIAASSTFDRYGKFVVYPQSMAALPIFERVAAGERVTVSALIKSEQPYLLFAFQSQFLTPSFFHGNVALGSRVQGATLSTDEPPIWVTFEYQHDTSSPYIGVAGKLYSLSVTRSNGQPVSTFQPQYQRAANINTDALSTLSATGATLNLTANPRNDGAMSVSIEYGTDERFFGARETANSILPNGASDVSVALDASALTPSNIYFYRAKATFAGTPEPILGNIRSFFTPPPGNPTSAIAMKRLANRHALIGMFGIPGNSYILTSSQDMVTWSPIGTMTAGPSGSFIYEDPDTEALDRRFYRLLTP